MRNRRPSRAFASTLASISLFLIAASGFAVSPALTRLLSKGQADAGFARYLQQYQAQQKVNRAELTRYIRQYESILGRYAELATRATSVQRDVDNRLRTSSTEELLESLRNPGFARTTAGYSGVMSELRRWADERDRLLRNALRDGSFAGVARSVGSQGRGQMGNLLTTLAMLAALQRSAARADLEADRKAAEDRAVDSAIDDAVSDLEQAFADAATCLEAAANTLTSCLSSATSEAAAEQCQDAYLEAWSGCLAL